MTSMNNIICYTINQHAFYLTEVELQLFSLHPSSILGQIMKKTKYLFRLGQLK